jgi:hypothetical protein
MESCRIYTQLVSVVYWITVVRCQVLYYSSIQRIRHRKSRRGVTLCFPLHLLRYIEGPFICQWSPKVYRIEILYLPGRTFKAVVFSDAVSGTICISCMTNLHRTIISNVWTFRLKWNPLHPSRCNFGNSRLHPGLHLKTYRLKPPKL